MLRVTLFFKKHNDHHINVKRVDETSNGSLYITFVDGSMRLYAAGTWQQVSITRVNND